MDKVIRRIPEKHIKILRIKAAIEHISLEEYLRQMIKKEVKALENFLNQIERRQKNENKMQII